MLRRIPWVVAVIVGFTLPIRAFALTYDVSITRAGVTFVPATFFLNATVRVYAQVENIGDRDVEGSIFVSENGTAIGTPVPFSAKARGAPEEVWVEWQPAVEGERQITVRVVTAPTTRDEDTANNEMIVPVTIDRDTDRDGIGDRGDTDDDNDGLPDEWETSHGLNPRDPSDAMADPDGDGRTTIEEYRAGTDPFRSDRTTPSVTPSAGGGSGGTATPSAPPVSPPVAPPATTPPPPAPSPVPKAPTAAPPATRGGVVAGVKIEEHVGSASGNKAGDAVVAFTPPELPQQEQPSATVREELASLLGERSGASRSIAPYLAGGIALTALFALVVLAVIRRRALHAESSPKDVGGRSSRSS